LGKGEPFDRLGGQGGDPFGGNKLDPDKLKHFRRIATRFDRRNAAPFFTSLALSCRCVDVDSV